MKIAYRRLRQAEESISRSDNDAAVGRLYYACLEAAKAAFSRTGTEGRISHRGASVLFHRDIVQTGVMEMKWGSFFAKLQRDRTLADYPEPDKEALIPDAHTVYGSAVEFVESVREIFVPSMERFESTLEEPSRRDEIEP